MQLAIYSWITRDGAMAGHREAASTLPSAQNCPRPHVVGWISLAASYLSPHLGNCHYSEDSTPHFGWRTKGIHFEVLFALSIKALSTCPQYLPLVRVDPHGSQTSLTENDN